MKASIHPHWHTDVIVTCSCGNTFTTESTQSEIHVEICSRCHPFFTGEMRFSDVVGKVDKFVKRQEHAKKQKYVLAKKKAKKSKSKPTPASAPQKTLKEMLMGL